MQNHKGSYSYWLWLSKLQQPTRGQKVGLEGCVAGNLGCSGLWLRVQHAICGLALVLAGCICCTSRGRCPSFKRL
jgi:hypothetical protein